MYVGWLKGRGPVIDTDGESALWTNSSRQLTQINSGERGVTTSVLLRPHTAAQSHWPINYSLFFFPSIKRSFFLSFSFNLSLITIIPLSWINIDLYHALFPLLLFLFSRIRSFLLLYFFPSNFNCVYKIKERTNSLWLNHAQIIRVHDRTLVCTTWKKKK